MCRYCGDTYHVPKASSFAFNISLREDLLRQFLAQEDYVIDNSESKEPALAVGTAVGSVSGLFFVLSYFFPNLLSENQIQLLLVLSSFVLPIATAIFTRGKVWSPASVQETVDKAVADAKKQIESKPQRGKLANPDPWSDQR